MQTHRPAYHPSSLGFFMLKCVYIFALSIFISTFALCLKNQCLIKILNVMEKYYLCSIQSKTTPGANEAVLVPVEEISAFVSSNLRPDCLLFISYCSTFKAIPDEK
jgi:hypothetical protein